MEPAGRCLKFSHFYIARIQSTAFLTCPAAKASLGILSLQGPLAWGGGLWEAAVRALKLQLKNVVGTHVLTHEQLATVIAEVEAILNSRPLIPLALDDSSVPTALTPGYFLIGRPLLAPPIRCDHATPISCLKRWKLTQTANHLTLLEGLELELSPEFASKAKMDQQHSQLQSRRSRVTMR